MLKEVKIQTPAGPETIFALDGLPVSIPELGIKAVVNHINIEYLPHGHEGFEVLHFDVHIYFVDAETLAKLTT
ncbi:MAG: hypothetical protein NXY59_08820 [Aigarchaeota archaeon]|nr:hypothetical protein [Candidatus Pelearchaeum maunauluense]